MIEPLIVLAGATVIVAMSVIAVLTCAWLVLLKVLSESCLRRDSVGWAPLVAHVAKLTKKAHITWVKNIQDWPILTLTCALVGLCGFWSLVAAVAILLQEPTSLFLGLGIGFIFLGLGCFGVVCGLWKRRVWARQAVMTMSVINLAANLFMLVQLSRPILDIGNWVALFPIAFVCLVFWYFRRPDVRLAFTFR